MDIEKKNNSRETHTCAIWCITPGGAALAQKLQKDLEATIVYASEKLKGSRTLDLDAIYFSNLSEKISDRFHQHASHICIFSTGITVRLIAGLLKSKLTDPAVVCLDDQANFAVSLVSGHIGGANALARKVAESVNCTPVITTATDVNNLPAIDMIAKQRQCFIETPQNIKHVSMKILNRQTLNVFDPENIITESLGDSRINRPDSFDDTTWDVVCTPETMSVSRETLVLRPSILAVGIGCNRNTPVDIIKDFLMKVFRKEGLSIHSICRIGTSDVKKDEAGILALAEEMDIPLYFFNKEALNTAGGVQTPSAMAKKHLGVNSVSEAAAILASRNNELLVTKKKNKDVTIAVAIMK